MHPVAPDLHHYLHHCCTTTYIHNIIDKIYIFTLPGCKWLEKDLRGGGKNAIYERKNPVFNYIHVHWK